MLTILPYYRLQDFYALWRIFEELKSRLRSRTTVLLGTS